MLNKEQRAKNKEYSVTSKRVVVYVLFSIFYSINTQAQCAMCRAALESEGNSVKAEAVNDGIMYLMAIPYILVGVAGYFIYRMFNKKKA